jgi:hypothetical protein
MLTVLPPAHDQTVVVDGPSVAVADDAPHESSERQRAITSAIGE